MVSGPEHYKLAEELIGYVKRDGAELSPGGRSDLIALAQVHATLALAAASALMQIAPDGTFAQRDHTAWYQVAGTKKPKEDFDEDDAAAGSETCPGGC